MAKTENTKEKLIYIQKLLQEKSDEEHPMTITEIVKDLENIYNIQTERKSVSRDLATLENCGIILQAENQNGRSSGYYYDRTFEIPELITISSAIISSKFLTRDKTHELLKKLKSLASIHEANQLTLQMSSDRIKLDNKSVYINIYNIYEAIINNKKIGFEYYKYDQNKNLVPHNSNKPTLKASPYQLVWVQDNYYAVSINELSYLIYYRIDRMKNVTILEEPRANLESCNSIQKNTNLDDYISRSFNMFTGKEERVEILFHNDLTNLVIEKFGNDVIITKVNDDHFKINVQVVVSNGFVSWVLQFGSKIKVLGPENVQQMIKDEINKVNQLYD